MNSDDQVREPGLLVEARPLQRELLERTSPKRPMTPRVACALCEDMGEIKVDEAPRGSVEDHQPKAMRRYARATA